MLWTTQWCHRDRSSQAFPLFPPPHRNLPARSCYTLLQSYGSTCTSSWEKVQGVRSKVYLANPWNTFSYRGRKSCIFMHQDDVSGNQQKVKGWSCSCTQASSSTGFLIANLLEVRDSSWDIQVPCSYPLSWCICYRNAITMVLSRWGCPLWNFENVGLLNSLTKLLQHHGDQDAELPFNALSKMCFCSMENDMMSNVFFPFSTSLSYSSCCLQKRKIWFNLNTRAELCGKKNLYYTKSWKQPQTTVTASSCRKQKYGCSWCKCSSQRVGSTPKVGTHRQSAVVEPQMMFLHHTIVLLWPTSKCAHVGGNTVPTAGPDFTHQ